MKIAIAVLSIYFSMPLVAKAASCTATCGYASWDVLAEVTNPNPTQGDIIDWSNYCLSLTNRTSYGSTRATLCDGSKGMQCSMQRYGKQSVSGYGANEYEARQAVRTECESLQNSSSCHSKIQYVNLRDVSCI